MSNLATIVNNILADSGIDDINVVVTNGSYSNPAWITALSWSKITSTPTTLSGYGITDAVPAIRTITINGDTQDLSANRTWSVGTVTSVDMTVPTGFAISGRPITSSGTLALTFSAGYSLPTTAVQSNWTTAYNDSIISAAVSGTTTKTLTLTQQDGGTITASWTDYDTAPVTSVNAGTGISVNQTTGAVTVTNTGVLVNDITSSSGQGRFGGWYQGNGYTGPALEVGYSGGAGNVIAYDRSGGGYQPLYITGSNLYLRQSGGLVYINSQLVRESAGVGWLSGNYASSETSTTTGAIYSIGGSYYPTGSTLNSMYGVGYTHTNQGQMISGANSWGFYVTGNGTVRVWLGGDNGNIIASGDIYANTSSIVATRTWVNSQGFITGGPYLPLSGGTLTGPVALNDSAYFRGSPTYGFRFNNNADTLNNMTLTNSSGNLFVRGQIYVGGNGFDSGTQVVYNSGTWGISITGNADTVDGYHATNAASGLAYYASNGYLYIPSWMNVDNGGIFSNTNNAHFRPNPGSYGPWLVTGSRNGWRGIEFESGGAGNVTLMIANDSNTSGIHNNSYGWQFRWADGTMYVYKNSYGGGASATVLDSSNYNSWAPTLTGGGASGTWGISITGSSGTAGSTQTLAYTYLGSGSVNVNNSNGAIYRTDSGSGAVLAYSPVLHIGGGDTMWQVQGSYGTSGNGTLYFRQGYNGSWGNWLTMLSSANYSSYALPLTGGTITGDLIINASGSYPLRISSTQRYMMQVRNTNNTVNSGYGWWWFMDTNFNMGFHADGAADRMTLTRSGDLYLTSNMYVNGNGSSTGTQVVYNSGTWGINISGNAATATSSGLLSWLGSYVWSASTQGRDFAQGMQVSFVSANEGYPEYGSVVRIHTYPNDGASAEIYVPYSSVYGGTAMRYRLGQYNNAGWTGWKTIIDDTNYNNYSPTLTGGGASGTWGINITGSAGSASTASQVTINYNNDSNSAYQMLWGSGNSVYGTAGVYVNPYTDTIYTAAYRGNANVAGTGEAIYTPAGIYSTGTNWLYGTMYLNANPIYDTGDIRTYNSGYFFRARYATGSDIYHGSLNWYGLQLGNNGDNYIIAGRTNTGGALLFYTNNTSDFTTVNGTFAAKMHSSGRTSFGGGSDIGYQVQVYGSLYASDWIRVNGNQGLYFESYGGGWRMTDSSYIRSYNGKSLSMEGASVDYVSSIYMNGGVYIDTFNNRNLIVKSTGGSDAGILGRGSGNQFAFQVYGSGGDYGFLNSAWGAWDIRKTANGALYMNDNTSYYLYTNTTDVSARINGAIYSNSSFATDGYGASSNAATGRVYGPKGGAYSYSGGTIYGAIKIRLPFRANDSMWSMKVRIYNYAQQQTSEYLLGNYSYSQGAYNFSATYLGGSSSNAYNVRFGNEGGYDCVWIGETGTGWSYPIVSVMDFTAGYSNGGAVNSYQNWDVSVVGSFGTVGATVAPNIKFGNAFASYYYDSADSNYYVRPSSLSYMHTVSSFYVQNNYGVSTDHAYGIYFDSGRSTAYAIYRESGAWDFPYPDLRIAFHTGIKIGANASYKGVRFYTDYDMSGLVLSVNNADYNTGGIYVHGTAYASAYYEWSDARVKTILEDNSRVKGIESIKPKLYEKDGKTEFGYIAQDFLDIMPYAINNDNVDGYYSLVYREVHTAKIAYLEDSIEEIKAKILYLENQLKTKQ